MAEISDRYVLCLSYYVVCLILMASQRQDCKVDRGLLHLHQCCKSSQLLRWQRVIYHYTFRHVSDMILSTLSRALTRHVT